MLTSGNELLSYHLTLNYSYLLSTAAYPRENGGFLLQRASGRGSANTFHQAEQFSYPLLSGHRALSPADNPVVSRRVAIGPSSSNQCTISSGHGVPPSAEISGDALPSCGAGLGDAAGLGCLQGGSRAVLQQRGHQTVAQL